MRVRDLSSLVRPRSRWRVVGGTLVTFVLFFALIQLGFDSLILFLLFLFSGSRSLCPDDVVALPPELDLLFRFCSNHEDAILPRSRNITPGRKSGFLLSRLCLFLVCV